MRLRGTRFSPNGHGDLVGTIVAYSDGGQPLGAEQTGNYSRDAGKMLMRKLTQIGQDPEVAGAQLAQVLAQIRSGVDQAAQQAPPPPASSLPEIAVGRPLRDIVDASWSLLAGDNSAHAAPRWFRLGDLLAEIAGQPTPRPVQLAALRLHLDRLSDYVKAGPGDQIVAARPPRDMLESMLAVVPDTLPVLNAVSRTPYLDLNGQVVATEGYDWASGIYLALDGLAVPPVPARPTVEQVAAARALLQDELLGDFLFVTQADKATAVAALVLPVVRHIIDGPAPLHVFEAPIEGTGKGLLAAVVGIVAGYPPAVMTEGGDDSEWRKRITAVLLSSPPIVLLDNVRARLDSAALSSVLTAWPNWSDRVMGTSRLASVPVRCLWLVTGNNPTYSGEIARRVVRSRIDAGVERPWERKAFRYPDLLAWTHEHRAELVNALLTLARAWVTAGRPGGTATMGSFEQWARVVGGILDVAGIPGLLTNREEVYLQATADGEAWRALLDHWWAEYGVQRVGVDQVMELATRHKLLTDLRAGRSERGARTALGMELSKLRDRVLGPAKVHGAGQSSATGAAMYNLSRGGSGSPEKVTEVPEVTGDATE